MNRPASLRDIRLEDRARRAVDEAIQRWCGAERAWSAIEWALIHDPFAGASLVESGRIRAFIFVGAASVEWPDVRVIYEATKELIIIHDATFEDAKARFVGHG